MQDVVNAIMKSLQNFKVKGEIINIGTGKPQKIKDIISFLVKRLKGGKPNFGKIKLRKDEAIISYPSIKRANTILNWKPVINLEEGLRRTILEYKKN